MFLDICPNNKRDRATLEKMIMRRVRRGTTILTDKWGGYIGLEGLGNIWFCHHFCLTLYSGMDYKHMTVNHANNFKDPITGVHTNGIEGRYWKHYLFLVHSSILSFKVALYKEEASKEWQLWSWIVSKALAALSSFLSMTTKYTYVALPYLTQ